MFDLIPEEFREEFTAMAQEASFGEFNTCEMRDALCEALKSKRDTEDGSRYCYIVDVFRSFFVANEEDFIDGKYISGYYKRPYASDGLNVTVGDRGMRVEKSWVELLRPVAEEVVVEPVCCDYESVERGEPCQEALEAEGVLAIAREVTDSFREATFENGIIKGIVPIRPGLSKNNRLYSESVLKRDLNVFNGNPVFYDHQDPNQPKPLKNIIGVLENARWDDELKAPRADLKYPASMETVIEEIKQKHAMLGPDRVGFSIDMPITVAAKKIDGKMVKSVEAMLGGDNASTDIVFRPAAGGSFDQALEAQGNDDMALLEGMTLEEIKAARPELFPAPVAVVETAPVAVTEEVTQETIDEKVSKAASRLFNESAFKSRVSESKVPQKIKDAMLREAKSVDFEPSACESVLNDWLNVATANAGGPEIKIPGFSTARVVEADDVRHARLLGAAMGCDQEVNGQTIRRFTSLREALGAFHPEFKMLATDSPQKFAREAINQLHWGGGELSETLRERGQEATSITSSTFSNAWADVMNKTLLKEMADPELNTWRPLVSDFVSFGDLTRSHKFIRVGDYPDIATVSEGAPYQYMTGASEEKVEFGISKYGNLEKYTWESALADDLGVLGRIPRKLGRAWAWTVYRFIYALFTANTGTGVTMDYDSTVLYHANHSNIATAAFTAADLVTAEGKFRQQTDITQTSNFKMYRAKYLLYANETALRQAVWEALISSFKVNPLTTSGSQVNLPNYIREYLGLEPIEVMYAGTTTRWELVADPRNVSTIAVGFLQGMETPEIFVQDMERVGSVFNSDQITYKIRGTIGADVLDHRSFVRGNL